MFDRHDSFSSFRPRGITFLLALCLTAFAATLPAQDRTDSDRQAAEEEPAPGSYRIIPFALPFGSSDVGNGALGNVILSGKTADGTGENTIFVIGAATNTGLRVGIAQGRFKRAGGWTLSGQVGLVQNPMAFYFGRGNFQDMQKITRIQDGRDPVAASTPESPDILEGRDVSLNLNYLDDLARRKDYRVEPNEINPGRAVLAQQQNRFYQYGLKRNMGNLSLQKQLGDSPLNIIGGFAGARVITDSYQGDRDNGDFFPNTPTLLDLNRPVGYDSTERVVYANTVRIGLEYDSLPAERRGHPNSGMRSGLRFESAGTSTGSHYTYDRLVAYHHQYLELFPSYFQKSGREMVLAYRLFGIQTFGDIPFFQEKGLGGTLLRGYPANQFIDRVTVGGSLELRYTAFPAKTEKGTSFGFLIFGDTGRVAPTPEEIDSYNWHRAGGAGVNVIFGNRFAIELVGGVSKYQKFFSLQIGHTLDFRG